MGVAYIIKKDVGLKHIRSRDKMERMVEKEGWELLFTVSGWNLSFERHFKTKKERRGIFERRR